MPNTFKLKVMTPEKSFISEDVQEIIFSTPVGRMGMMAGHMPIVAAVSECTLEILIDGAWKTAAVSQGFLDVTEDAVELFLDTFEWSNEIDANRAREALERAEQRLKNQLSQVQQVRTQSAMARAIARINTAVTAETEAKKYRQE